MTANKQSNQVKKKAEWFTALVHQLSTSIAKEISSVFVHFKIGQGVFMAR